MIGENLCCWMERATIALDAVDDDDFDCDCCPLEMACEEDDFHNEDCGESLRHWVDSGLVQMSSTEIDNEEFLRIEKEKFDSLYGEPPRAGR